MNTFLVRDLTAPFGGVGISGIGREGGDYALRLLLRPQDAAGPERDDGVSPGVVYATPVFGCAAREAREFLSHEKLDSRG